MSARSRYLPAKYWLSFATILTLAVVQLPASAAQPSVLEPAVIGLGPNELIVPNGQRNYISAVFFRPDGKQIVTAAADGTAIVWEASTGRKLWQVESKNCCAGTLSADGQWLSLGSTNGTVFVWRLSTRRKHRTILAHAGALTSLAVDKAGRRLLSASVDGSAAIWEIDNGRQIQEFSARAPITMAGFTPDESSLVIASADGEVAFWDPANGKHIRTLNAADHAEAQPNERDRFLKEGAIWERHHYQHVDFAISPDGRLMGAGPFDGKAVVWKLPSGEKRFELGDSDKALASLAFTSDSKQLLTQFLRADSRYIANGRTTYMSKRSGELVTWNSVSGRRVVASVLDEPIEAWRPGAEQYVPQQLGYVQGNPTKVETFDTQTNLLGVFRGNFETPLAVSRDSARIAFASENELNVFEAKPSPHTVSIPIKENYPRANLAGFSADGKLLAASGWRWAKAWDIDQQHPVAAHNFEYTVSLDFSRDGRRFLTAADGNVCIWDLENNDAMLRGLPGSYASYSSNGKQIATVGKNDIQIFDATSFNLLRTTDRPKERSPTGFSLSPDGNLLAASDTFSPVELWDIKSGRLLNEFSGFPDDLVARAFNHETNSLAVGSSDFRSIRWTAVGERMRATDNSNAAQTRRWFSDDGKLATCGFSNGSVVYHDAQTGEKLLTLVVADTGDWIGATPGGLFECSDGGRKLFSFHVGPGIEATSAEQLAGKFYHAGLFDAILSGKRPN